MKSKYWVVILLLCLISASTVFIMSQLESVKEQALLKMRTELLRDLKTQEDYAEEIGFVTLTSISEDKKIIESLKEHNREMAIAELNKIISQYKEKTRIKSLKIHIHTADLKSFVRSWRLDKYGDDLSGFRETIKKVKADKRPVFAFEVGRVGLTLRYLLPIVDEKKQYLGSIEIIQQFDQVPNKFRQKGNNYLLLMDKSYLDIGKYLKDAPDIQNYKVSSKYFNDQFVKDAQAVNFHKMFKNHYYLDKKYFYTYKTIKDINGKTVGLHLLAMPAKKVQETIAHSKNTVIVFYIICTLGLSLLILIIYFLIQKR